MVDWVTVADFATAIGTTLLAVATFAATRSANRSARSAERALLEGIRPILLPSNWSDAPQKVRYMDGSWVVVHGGRATVDVTAEFAYVVLSVRNAGNGIAVLHGWSIPEDARAEHAEPADFFRLTRDIYVPTSDPGFCQVAARDTQSVHYQRIRRGLTEDDAFAVDVLYSDAEGSQRVISRFYISRGPARHDESPAGDGGDLELADGDEYALTVSRHWNLDLPSPRG